MPVKTRIDPISRDITVLFPDVLSPAARSALLADEAQTALDEALEINAGGSGAVVPYTQSVDGVEGAPFSAVLPDGVIIVEFSLTNSVVQWIWDAVVAAVPVRTGQFKQSLLLFADGEQMEEPDPAIDAAEWVITSNAPYARKLEGISGRRPPLSKQAPHGVFQAVADQASRRFGNVASIKFTARSVEGGALALWAARTALRKTRNGRKVHQTDARRADWLSRQPCITVTFR